MSLPRIKEKYGPSGIQDFPKTPSLFTDDTQMSIAIAEALIKVGDRDIETIMAAVRDEFIKWYHSPENNRAPGKTCLIGIENMERGQHWSESGVARSKGCGSAMRVAPIGYFYQHDPDKLKKVAHASGICTHDFTSGISDEFDEAILKVKECLNWEDEEKALDHLGKGWIGEEAVALAMYCFLRYPNDYRKVVLRGANTNGDSDSIACIAGSISGAFLGIKAIPQEWIDNIEKTEYLDELAKRLSEKK